MSAPCYRCHAVKRVKMYIDHETRRPIYLCKRDATRYGYRAVDMAAMPFTMAKKHVDTPHVDGVVSL